uniref:Zinc finger MYM-type protein 1 n=1 Tax=Cacopsylla melanoneura TaxID=428564 RepID=A0A8D8U0H2_9HEMI
MKGEAELWYVMWHKKNLSSEEAQEIDVIDLIREATPFFPAMRKALIILSSLPPTTATVERSFSTLRKIKTWLRSTMGEDRLNGLSLMSVHRKLVEVQREEIQKSTLQIFARNPRRMLFQ